MTQQGQPPQPEENDVMAEILERAGLENINEVPLGTQFSWGKQGVWSAEGPVPIVGFEQFFIFAMFQNTEEVKVYAVPKDAPAGSLPHRFTLCKRSPAYFVEIIRSKDVFVDEIAKDLIELAMNGAEQLFEDEEEEEEEEDEEPEHGAPGPQQTPPV